MKREGFVVIQAEVLCLSGTRVGGTDDELAIGGVDLPVIKHPITREPYLPGSSMKGRLRNELERQLGSFGGSDSSQPCDCVKPTCPVCRLFGPHNAHRRDKRDDAKRIGPTRIIVRDLPWVKPEGSLSVILETKTESINNRRSGAAEHPRTSERVPSGSKFKFEVSIQVYDEDKEFEFGGKKGANAFACAVLQAMKGVEQTGIGSSVSRGSGQIKFENIAATYKGQPISCS